jgi:streptomycin 3"-adenylyltransferase
MQDHQVDALLFHLVDHFHSRLKENLVGCYLHGSLVMGGFNWDTSDVDFVVVVREKLDADTKKDIITFALSLEPVAPPKGLEFSVVLVEHTLHFSYPTPYELHYSPSWAERYRAGQVDYEMPREDPDLAAHFTIIRIYGVCLFGDPIPQVFGEVPSEYYWASIRADADDILNNVTANPVYSVLNLCRVLTYKYKGAVVSKLGGGGWGLQTLDSRYHKLIQRAVQEYQTPKGIVWDKQELEDFARYARQLLETTDRQD